MKPVTKMTLQQCRDAVTEATQSGDWERVVQLKQRIGYIRKVQAARAKEPLDSPLSDSVYSRY